MGWDIVGEAADAPAPRDGARNVSSPDGMSPAFLRKTAIGAAVTGLALAAAVAVRFGNAAGLGFAVGLAWSLANFWALAGLLRAGVRPDTRQTGRAVAFGAVKVVLYGLGIALLVTRALPVAALAAGFAWLFAAMVLRAGGAMWLDRKRGDTTHG